MPPLISNYVLGVIRVKDVESDQFSPSHLYKSDEQATFYGKKKGNGRL